MKFLACFRYPTDKTMQSKHRQERGSLSWSHARGTGHQGCIPIPPTHISSFHTQTDCFNVLFRGRWK